MPLELEEFLYGWVSAEDLKDLLYSYGCPVTGTKDVLVSRLLEIPKLNPVDLIMRLKKPTIINALDRHDLPIKGTRPLLAMSLIAEDVVEVAEKEIMRYVEGLSAEDFHELGALLILVDQAVYADRILRFVPKFGRKAESMLKELIANLPKERSIPGLTKLISEGDRDVPCLSAYLLEGVLEENRSVAPAEGHFARFSDAIRACQRKIRRSCEENPDLVHPAVSSLLSQVWEGQLRDQARPPALSTRAEVRKMTERLRSSEERENRDYFIAHASEDKNEIARPLAKELASRGGTVWYDEFELLLGDSLIEKIDAGLATSRFGVVILSPSFFAKNWPRKELDGLIAKEAVQDRKVVLPIRHRLTVAELSEYSPILAGRLSVSTDAGIKSVADEIIKAARGDSKGR